MPSPPRQARLLRLLLRHQELHRPAVYLNLLNIVFIFTQGQFFFRIRIFAMFCFVQ